MGSYGSGRRSGYSRKIEDRLRIDIRELRKSGDLQRPGSSVTCGLYSGSGHLMSSVGLIIGERRVWFLYQTRDRHSGAALQENRHSADIERMACRFGGTRPWFICPNSQCSRRVATIYLDDGELGCRHCHRLVYESQSETPADRARRRERKIRRKLGMGPNLFTPLADKPKSMHWRTYLKLRDTALRYGRISTDDLARQTPTLRTRFGG